MFYSIGYVTNQINRKLLLRYPRRAFITVFLHIYTLLLTSFINKNVET